MWPAEREVDLQLLLLTLILHFLTTSQVGSHIPDISHVIINLYIKTILHIYIYHNGASGGSVALPVYPARLGDEVSESEVL